MVCLRFARRITVDIGFDAGTWKLSSFEHNRNGTATPFSVCNDYATGVDNYGPGEMMRAYFRTGDTTVH